MPTQQSHEAREVAEGFGADAERYDRARPSYPRAVVDRIVAASPGRDVLDVGCGTGIAARQFQAAGCTVLGVDVDPRMAERARGTGLDVEVAKFEAWDARGATFDAVVSGQTWHWIDPAAGAAKAAQVLKPGGILALFWNVFQPAPAVAEAFAAVYRHTLPDAPANFWSMNALAAYSSLSANALDGIRAAGAFAPPEEWRFEWERRYAREEWLDQVPTHGGHAQLPAAQLETLLAGLGAAIDAVGGSFTMGYTTLVISAERARS